MEEKKCCEMPQCYQIASSESMRVFATFYNENPLIK